ncbi:TPA: nickel-dependent lactate racemase [Thermoplasmata archaeon]|nr:nickel-dependent lactate racemase [Thermoplasmata archaeon]
MRVEVPYGDGTEVVEVPDRNMGEIVYPNELPDCDEMELLRAAFNAPIESARLDMFLEGAEKVLVIVNDATRPTPTAKVLDIIEETLNHFNAEYVVATGMHRAPTEEEYRFIFGDRYGSIKERVHSHDSRTSETVRLGTTSRGTEVRFNRMVLDADRVVVIGSVEPHYFAGYTGGRKAFLPGISAFETIEQNHKLALTLEAQALRLGSNPVHEDMVEAMAFLKDKRVFSIMAVLDKEHKVCSAYAGDIDASFQAAVKKADEVFVVRMRKADIAVAVTSFPHDIDLYQSQKALDNAKLAVRDGGVIILVSACRTGVGADTFLKLLGSAATPREALEKISKEFKLGYHKAAKMAEIGLKIRMFAVTKLDPEIARRAHMTPMPSLQVAVDKALKELGPEAKVTFIMDAVITVPKVESG